MERDRVAMAAYLIALVLAVGYAAAGIVGWIADVTDGDGSDLAFWLLLLLGGAALILFGLFGVARWSWASVVLVSVGAIAGALALVDRRSDPGGCSGRARRNRRAAPRRRRVDLTRNRATLDPLPS
jgi:peptidoglycan/LPS O-acetylase OafA/YrhL